MLGSKCSCAILSLRATSWERALREAQSALDKAGEKTAALVGGEATNEEGYLVQFLMRNVLGSPHVDSRLGGALDPEQARMLARPDLTARTSDLDYAGAILVLDTELVDEMPILDLRVRKNARRRETPVVVASSVDGWLVATTTGVSRRRAFLRTRRSRIGISSTSSVSSTRIAPA